MVPKRFKSLCSMAKWMKDNEHKKRVFMVQKQDCATLIDTAHKSKKFKSAWGRKAKHGNKKCKKDYGCNTEICVNDDGFAKTFPNVYLAYQYLSGPKLRKQQVIAVGLGKCSDLYGSGCIYTEWFDLDDPVSDDVEEESVPFAHQMVLSSDLDSVVETEQKDKGVKKMGKMHKGMHRSCPPTEMMGGAEFMTTSGQSKLGSNDPGHLFKTTELKVQCRNSENEQKVSEEFSWDEVQKNVTCRDWKIRYCCKDMWGGTGGTSLKPTKNLKRPSEMVRVDKPERDYLFEGCRWRKPTSTKNLEKSGSDDESKLMKLDNKIRKKLKGETKKDKNYCKGFALGTRFIDVRTQDEQSLPYDEVKDQDILKLSPVYGFMCKGKTCKDYNVRYCCIKKATDYGDWKNWQPWTKCNRECGGGNRERTRTCEKGKECYAASDSATKQEEPCNTDPCGKNSAEKYSKWGSWSDCDVSCGEGHRRRFRTCQDTKGCKDDSGKPLKFGDKESHDGTCKEDPCPKFQWGKWTAWAGCDSDKCDKVTYPVRVRKCFERLLGDPNPQPATLDDCGGEEGSKEANKVQCPFNPCKQDGKWTKWSKWGQCQLYCKQIRLRSCSNPAPAGKGKDCEGPNFEEKECKPEGGKKCSEEPCVYSTWSPWGSCSVTCGTHDDAMAGVRSRHRHVIRGKLEECKKDNDVGSKGTCQHCTIRPQDVKKSNFEKPGPLCIKECPRDCEYGQWTSWTSSMNKKCVYCNPASGPVKQQPKTMTRTRKIKTEAIGNGEPCDKKVETVSCKDVHVDKKCSELQVTQWGDWSECLFESSGEKDVNCQNVKGVQRRTRFCKSKGKGKKKCSEKISDERSCLEMCPNTDPYEPWSKWTECKGKGIKKEKNGEKCGTGTRHRTRKCQKWIKKDPNAMKKFCRQGKEEKVDEICGFGNCMVKEEEEINP